MAYKSYTRELGAFYLREKVPTNAISAEFANYMDLRTGGEVSGNIGVLSGNFVQQVEPGRVEVYSGHGSFGHGWQSSHAQRERGYSCGCFHEEMVGKLALRQ